AKHSEGEKFFFSISAEKARDITADVFIFYADGQEQIEKITKDPLLGEIPAIKKGHYVASADRQVSTTLSSPSPLSMEVAVTKFGPGLAKAGRGRSRGGGPPGAPRGAPPGGCSPGGRRGWGRCGGGPGRPPPPGRSRRCAAGATPPPES